MANRTPTLQVEIDPEKVLELLNAGVLCAADLRCLDAKSKDTLWQLCLHSCTARLAGHCPRDASCGFPRLVQRRLGTTTSPSHM